MHIPRKRFGQHFLRDEAVIRRIVAALDAKPGQHLVEIGSGQGALTLPVLKQVHHLEAIELDRELIPLLSERCERAGNLILHEADVLDFDFAGIRTDDRFLRIFGNLPYNISTPLIFHLIAFADIIEDMLFMLQKEVAERLAAGADTEHYGRLSVMVQYHCQAELLFDVPRRAFHPPPQVESTIVRLVPHEHYPCKASDERLFATVVKQAFGQRRKTLRNSLKEVVDDEIWESLSIRSDLRAEKLTVREFVDISNAVTDALNRRA
ncbi:Ribosomal RNA small subunit methyltransferase A [Aquicella siphonis]|uniref:Ribosomal RNA small subunit methyltransferase A n=1 Tax=Aquicella siphonis TaxID=254247 RepID=A0A5E4PKS7_9COXI|nr:16S rRNA (adenine(1518)-N(6)/adenine(1519)-N(6))-dimethyltransferase RsmA [Aquicella siphonis]VVC76852.1 Ribosomal RNA small subunit methyltransferase A [Aquicella siphonis]